MFCSQIVYFPLHTVFVFSLYVFLQVFSFTILEGLVLFALLYTVSLSSEPPSLANIFKFISFMCIVRLVFGFVWVFALQYHLEYFFFSWHNLLLTQFLYLSFYPIFPSRFLFIYLFLLGFHRWIPILH